jgi:hypothetical protein
MKVNLLLILLVFGQNFVFGQEKSEREISKSVIVIGKSKTKDEAKYNAILSAFNASPFGQYISSASCFDEKETSFAIMVSTVVDDFEIIEEQILSENDFILTLNIVLSSNCAYLAFRPSFQEETTHIIFKKKEQAEQYLKYLTNIKCN